MRLSLCTALLLASAACAREPSPVEVDPIPPPQQDGFAFTYAPPAGAPAITSLSVAGSFNGWNATATPLARQPDGSWVARVQLADGRHEYKFHINGAWPVDMCDDGTWGDPARGYWVDPDAMGCLPDGHNGQNALLAVGTAADPGLGFLHEAANPADVSAAGGRISVRFRANQQQVQGATLRYGGVSAPMHLQMNTRLLEVWRGTLPESATSYSVSVQTAGGTQEFGPFAVPAGLFRAVPWVGGAVAYQVFPERFWNGDRSNDHLGAETDAWHFMHAGFRGTPPVTTREWNGPVLQDHCCHQYFGGDLQGVIDRLDYLRSLGVTLVYLNPIFSSGSVHGYDTFDYLKVEPGLGDERVLRTLLEQARARGIRVM